MVHLADQARRGTPGRRTAPSKERSEGFADHRSPSLRNEGHDGEKASSLGENLTAESQGRTHRPRLDRPGIRRRVRGRGHGDRSEPFVPPDRAGEVVRCAKGRRAEALPPQRFEQAESEQVLEPIARPLRRPNPATVLQQPFQMRRTNGPARSTSLHCLGSQTTEYDQAMGRSPSRRHGPAA